MKANIKKALTGIVLLAMLLTAILPYTAMANTGDTSPVSLDDGDDHGNDYVTGENLLGAGITTTIPASYFKFEVEGQESYTPDDFEGIASGTLSGNVPTIAIDGTTYTYEYAYLDGNKQKKVTDVVMYNDSVYYRLDGDYVAAVKLGADKKITLKYSIPFDQYDVTYKSATTTALLGKFDGAAKAPETKGAENFTAYYTMPATVSAVAFTITRTNADGTTTTLTQYKDAETAYDYKVVSEEGGSRYDIVINSSAITGALTIAATETAKTTYLIKINGSNSAYKTSNATGSSWIDLEQKSDSTDTSAKINNASCASATFYLHGRHQWSTNAKGLNKITVTIGTNAYYLNLPETAGGSAITTISGANGNITFTVARSTETSNYKCSVYPNTDCYTPDYTITITNCYEDVSIDTNFQDLSEKEIWLAELVGVDPIYVVNDLSAANGWSGSSTDKTWNTGTSKYIGKSNFKSSRSNEKWPSSITFYVKAKDGYELSANSVTVTKQNSTESVPVTSITLTELDDATKTSSGYTHKFTIDTSTWNNSSDGYYYWRIAIKATPKTSTYTVYYDLNNGTGTIADQTVATATSAFTVTTTQPTLEGKYFAGWTATLKADDKGTKATTTLYPGSATHFDLYDATETQDTTTGVYNQTITLKATWSDAPVNLETSYTIKVIVHDRTGEYMQTKDADGNTVYAIVDLEEKGYPDDELYVPLSALDSKVIAALKEKGFTGVTTLNGLYTENLVNFKISDLPGGIKQIDFYQYATVDYKVVTEGSTEVGGTVNPTQNKFPIKAQGDTSKVVPSSTAIANEDFVFVGWYSDEACSDDKLVTTHDTITTTMPEGGWPEAALTFYAKFKPNTTTVTVYKTVSSSVPRDKTKDYSFTYKIGDNGEEKTFTITGEGNYKIENVQIGSTLVIKEETSNLYTTTYTHGTENGGNEATIKVAANDAVKFTNTRKTAKLKIEKTMSSIVPSDLTGSINFSVEIKDGDSTIDTKSVDVDLTKNANANTATGSNEIEVPYGTTVKVTENLTNPGWYDTTVTGNNVTMDGDKTVTFTNTRKTQKITIQKQVDSILPSDKNKEFTINYTYGEDRDEKNGSFTLKADGTGTVDVPYGMTISVAENLTGTDATTYDPYYSINGSDYSKDRDQNNSQITVPSKNEKTLYVKNFRKTGTLKLTKSMVSTVFADANKIVEFKIDVYDTDGTTLVKTYVKSITLSNKETATPATQDLPYGTKIVVSEVFDSDAEKSYYDTEYALNGETTKSDTKVFSEGITPNKETVLAFTNTRKTATVTVVKNVENAISTDATDFTFKYKVGNTSDEQTLKVTVTKGEDGKYTGSNTISMPAGEKLTIKEDIVANTYTTVWSGTNGNTTLTDGSTTEAAIDAVAASGATLNFTNTRENATITISKTMKSIVDADATKKVKFSVVVKDGDTELTDYSKTGDNVLSFNLTASSGSTSFVAPLGTTYTITEEFPDGDSDLYTVSPANGVAEGEVRCNAEVEFTNTRKTAYIKISKKAIAIDNDKVKLPETLVDTYVFDYQVLDANDNVIKVDGAETHTATIGIDADGEGSSAAFEVPYKAKIVVTEKLDDNEQYFDTTNGIDNGGKVATIASAENTDSTDPKVIKFTNTRKQVKVTLYKSVVNAIAADKDDSKDDVSITYTIVGDKDGKKDVQIRSINLDENFKGTKEVYVPAGYTLNLTENDVDSKLSNYDVSWTAKSGNTDLEGKTGVNYSVAVGLDPVTINCTNTRKLATITIHKEMVSDVPSDATKPVQYTVVVKDGDTVLPAYSKADLSFTLADKEGESTFTAPIGTTVTIGEIIKSGEEDWYTVTTDTNPTFTVTGDQTVNFTNTRNTTDLYVKKFMTSDVTVDATKEITLTADVYDGTTHMGTGDNTYTKTFALENKEGEAVFEDVPVGTKVVVTEQSFDSTVYTFAARKGTGIDTDNFAFDATKATFTINSIPNTQNGEVSAAIDNARKYVVEVIEKYVINPIAEDKTKYTFSYNYGTAAEKTAEIDLTNAMANDAGKLYGSTIIKVAVGTDLTVTETNVDTTKFTVTGTMYNGEATGSNFNGTEATITGVTDTGTGSHGVTFYNTRSVSYFTVSKKVVTGKRGGQEYTCTADQTEPFDWSYTVDGVEYTPESDLTHNGSDIKIEVPIGAVVVVTENMSDVQKAMYTEANGGSKTLTIDADPTKNVVSFVNTRNTGRVYVSKDVQGNFGDRSQHFRIHYTVTYPDGKEQTESSSIWEYDANDKCPVGTCDSTTLANLPYGTTVTVNEDAAGDYTTTSSVTVGDSTITGNNSITLTVSQPESTVTFTNSRSTTPDTGVLLDSLPYVLILLLVVGIGTLVFIRRRRHSDD